MLGTSAGAINLRFMHAGGGRVLCPDSWPRAPAPVQEAKADAAALKALEVDLSIGDTLLFRSLAERSLAAAPAEAPAVRASTDGARGCGSAAAAGAPGSLSEELGDADRAGMRSTVAEGAAAGTGGKADACSANANAAHEDAAEATR